jgi:hypothetical protein
MTISQKTCSKCKITKPITEYYKIRKEKPDVRSDCKTCNKLYLSRNKESKQRREKKYYAENKEHICSLAKMWRDNNKERTNTWQKEYKKNRYAKDAIFSIKERIRKLVLCSYLTNGYSKKSRTHEILGCSWEEFKVHIENKFTEGMSWENRSEWHLDHITPVSWGRTEEEIIALNHYTNFQPLWAQENLKKGNKFSG